MSEGSGPASRDPSATRGRTEGADGGGRDAGLVRLGYGEAARVVRKRAGNFYFAFLGQRAAARRALHAIYAFCREADDAADDGRGPEAARLALGGLRARLEEIYGGRPAVARDAALQDAVRRFRIERRYFAALLAGIERDLTVTSYASFDDLYGYCFEVASSVGLLCLPVFGRNDPLARRHAVDLGVGMQLTNVLRDLTEDARRKRVYLPRSDLERFGVGETDLLGEADARDRAAGTEDRAPGTRDLSSEAPLAGSIRAEERPGHPRVAALRGSAGRTRLDSLIRFEAARARRFLASGERLLPLLDPRERFCPWMLATLYGEVLDRIERLGARVLDRRVSLPHRRKLWLAAVGFARSLAPGERDPQNEIAEARASATFPSDHPRA